MNIEEEVKKAGFYLPVAPDPIGSYQAVAVVGNMMYISGQLPIQNGVLRFKGKVGEDVSTAEAYQAAELCALNVLSQIHKVGGEFNSVRIVRVDGYVNCASTFLEHAGVLDGASDLFSLVLSSGGEHIRSVLGCISLPLDAAVEIVVVAEIL